jgi:hypothetical protein
VGGELMGTKQRESVTYTERLESYSTVNRMLASY